MLVTWGEEEEEDEGEGGVEMGVGGGRSWSSCSLI